MKKRIIVYGIIALLPIAYWCFLGFCHLTADVSEAGFQKLEIGMTKWQVRRILGVLPDKSYHLMRTQTHENWVSENGTIMLAFDNADRLVWKDWFPEFKGPTAKERWEAIWSLDNFLIRIGYLRIVDG